MRFSIFCVLLLKLVLSEVSGLQNDKLIRIRRGASVYRMYIPSNSGHNPYLLNNNDPSAFLQYLGGQSGSGYGGGQSGGRGQNLLNSYNQHQASQPTYGSTGHPSTAGWTPAGSGGSTPADHYTPTFSSGGNSGGNSAGWAPRPTTPSNDHAHSASVLQHAAQGSFEAQTAVFNALTAGSRPTSYKGGCPGCD